MTQIELKVLWQNLKWRVVDRTIDSHELHIEVEAYREGKWERRMPGSVDGTTALCMAIQHWVNRCGEAERALARFEARQAKKTEEVPS